MDKLSLARSLRSEGKYHREIASALGISIATASTWTRGWRRELLLPKNRRAIYVTDELRSRIATSMSSDPDGTAKEVAARFYVENQLSMPEIAAILRVSNTTISSWLKQARVRTRSRVLLRTRERLRAANLGAKRWNWKGGITPDGHVRMAIGPFFTETGEVRESPAFEYRVAA